MVGILKMYLDAKQPKAELASLKATNRAVATDMQMVWGMTNKMFLAGVAGLAAMGGAFVAATALNKEFNKSLTHTKALSDLSTTQMNALSVQVRQLGISFGESSNTIAEGLVVLAKAGLSQTQIMEAMPTIVQLMKANASDFETAANIAMRTINAFGYEYSDLVDLMDKSQKMFQATLADIGDLQQGLQYAGSTARLAGVPFEHLLAMLGTLSDNAMVAGIASRSLNQMMIDIVEHVDEVQQWADSMGLGVEVIKDGVLNLNEIIPAFGKLGMSMEVLMESTEIFSTRAMRSWGILIGASSQYQGLLDEINNSSGELARTVGVQTESIASILTSMKETLFAPFKDDKFTTKTIEILKELHSFIGPLGQALSELVMVLVEQFAKILPYLINLLISFTDGMERGVSILGFFTRALLGMNPMLLKFYILWMMIRKMNISNIIMQSVKATQTYLVATQSATVVTLTHSEAMALDAAATAAAANMKMLLWKATAGIALGMMMAVTAYNRECAALGALTASVMAAAAAYQYFATAKAIAHPVLATAMVAGGVGVAAFLASEAVRRAG